MEWRNLQFDTKQLSEPLRSSGKLEHVEPTWVVSKSKHEAFRLWKYIGKCRRSWATTYFENMAALDWSLPESCYTLAFSQYVQNSRCVSVMG